MAPSNRVAKVKSPWMWPDRPAKCPRPLLRPSSHVAVALLVLMIFLVSLAQLRLTDGTYTAWLSVTDLRLYRDDQVTPRRELVGQIAARIAKGAGVIVAVGLSRPWQKLDDTVERHWLQVNNIHLQDDPAWQESALPV